MSKSYRDLFVWQKAVQLTIQIYSVTKKFPKEEIYGLSLQMRRAIVAIASNIAEGQSRGHLLEYIQFLKIAYGLAAELETQLLVAYKIKYISQKEYEDNLSLLYEVMKMLNSLIFRLKPKT